MPGVDGISGQALLILAGAEATLCKKSSQRQSASDLLGREGGACLLTHRFLGPTRIIPSSGSEPLGNGGGGPLISLINKLPPHPQGTLVLTKVCRALPAQPNSSKFNMLHFPRAGKENSFLSQGPDSSKSKRVAVVKPRAHKGSGRVYVSRNPMHGCVGGCGGGGSLPLKEVIEEDAKEETKGRE